MTRCALYARVSTEEQARRQTPCADQLDAARKFARERGWSIVLEASDEGISGSVWPRPGLARILEAARRGDVDAVVVWDWSRLAREDDVQSPGLAGHLRWLFERETKARLISILEGDEPPLLRDIRLAVAAEQRRSVAAASRRGLASRAERRLRMGGPALFGYRWISDEQLVIVPEEAAVIQQAFRLADPVGEGLSLREIGRRLGRDRAVIRYWLRNPTYAGAYFHRRFRAMRCRSNPRRHWAQRLAAPAVLAWDHHEAIIHRELWQRVQARLDEHREHNPGRAPTALQGLLHCGVCGEPLRRRYQRDLAGGATRVCYQCPDCPGRYRIDNGSAQVAALLSAELARPEFARRLARAESDADAALADAAATQRTELARLDRSIMRLEAAVADDRLPDPAGLIERLAVAQRARADAQAALQRAITEPRDRSASSDLPKLSARLRRLSRALSRASAAPGLEAALRPLLRSLCDRVDLWPEDARIRICLSGRVLLDRNQGGRSRLSCPHLVAVAGVLRAAGTTHRRSR